MSLVRCLFIILAVVAGVASLVASAHAAILERVLSGTTTVANSTTATSVTLDLPDASKAFVVCTTRSTSDNSNRRVTCSLADNALSIKPDVAPGAGAIVVSWYVAEFASGVSVQRNVQAFAASTGSVVVTLSPAVDCTKSFVLLAGERTAAGNATNNDEVFTFRAVLGPAGAPCTSGTTTSLELTRLDTASAATVSWQVVTMEGASVQRGVACIGATATCSAASNGETTTATIPTAVDTGKSFVTLTRTAGTATAGNEGLYFVRGNFSTAGTSVNGLTFIRGRLSTTANTHVNIGWEVVTLHDGSTTVGAGAAATSLTNAANGAGSTALDNVAIPSSDRTVLVPIFSVSAVAGANSATLYGELATSLAATTDTNLAFSRGVDAANAVAWGALVSFYRCANSRLCHVGAASGPGSATVSWSPIYDPACDLLTPNTCHALVLRDTVSITDVPVNGTAYTAGSSTIGTALVVHNGSGATAALTLTQTGLTNGQMYYYKVFPKTAATTYITTLTNSISEVTAIPQSGAVAWSYAATGGSALNAPIAGNGVVYISSNGHRLTVLNSADGTEVATPTHVNGAVQGYVSWWIPRSGGGEGVAAGDGLGFLTAMNGVTGARLWTVELGTDSVQAAVSVGVTGTGFSDAAFDARYPNDVIFAATRNASQTVNGVIAVQGSDGAVLWSFAGAPQMDRIISQPYIDYTRNRLWVASGKGPGVFDNQNSLWVLDLLNDGALLQSFTLGQLDGAPTLSFDASTVYVGAGDGTLYAINADTLVSRWSSAIAIGSAIQSFVWEDFDVFGRLYFVTSGGLLYCVEDQGAAAVSCADASIPVERRWTANPSAGLPASVSQPLVGYSGVPHIWVGGSDGRVYQLDINTGVVEKSLLLEAGTTIGDISTEDGDIPNLFVGSSSGRVYRINLTAGSLP